MFFVLVFMQKLYFGLILTCNKNKDNDQQTE